MIKIVATIHVAHRYLYSKHMTNDVEQTSTVQ